jgi:hypothetical protein
MSRSSTFKKENSKKMKNSRSQNAVMKTFKPTLKRTNFNFTNSTLNKRKLLKKRKEASINLKTLNVESRNKQD